MSPKKQTILGVLLIGLGVVAVLFQATEHASVYSLLAVLFGSMGGQQIGQANARSKRR